MLEPELGLGGAQLVHACETFVRSLLFSRNPLNDFLGKATSMVLTGLGYTLQIYSKKATSLEQENCHGSFFPAFSTRLEDTNHFGLHVIDVHGPWLCKLWFFPFSFSHNHLVRETC